MKFILTSFLIAILSTTTAWASTKKNPTYPATEEAPSEEVLASAPGYIGSSTPVTAEPESSDTAAAAAAKSKKTVSDSVKTSAAAPTNAVASTAAPAAISKRFDLVPTSQTEPLIRRLKLAEQLVVQYGRAYDYRVLTVVELQSILDQLNAEARKQTQARVDERMRSQAIIRAEASATNTFPEAVEESHDSIGSEAPEAPMPPLPQTQLN